MSGFPVVFVGYELANHALDPYQSLTSPTYTNPLHAYKGLLRDIEHRTHTPAAIVRYDSYDTDAMTTHTALCCFVDMRERAYDVDEVEAVRVPAAFGRVPGWVRTRGGPDPYTMAEAEVLTYGDLSDAQ
ncbi:hypothetical protein BJ912DRAFT_1143344 [Pholiota molesta]|nr:hypothetical protein BJ912DRAFT_1143344 [Pholiota molesta]